MLRILFAAALIALPLGSVRYYVVTIGEYLYHPDRLEIHPGDKVVWKNRDAADHTVTFQDHGRIFDSGRLSSGQSYERTFVEEGDYRYYSTLDENLSGTIIVRRAP